MILYFSLEPPHHWALLDRRHRVLDSGLAETLEGVPIHQRRITARVAVVPGELVTIHSLRIPARSCAKAVAAIPYMLEESLASNVDDLEFRLLRWVRGGESKVAVVSREVMDQWHARLGELPGRVTGLVPEYFLLPRHSDGRCTLAADGRGRLVVRSSELDGLVIDQDELDLWWQSMDDEALPVTANDTAQASRLVALGGVMVSEWPIGETFPEWLQHDHQVPDTANLLRRGTDEAESAATSAWLKVAAALFGLAVMLRVGVDGYEHVTLAAEEARLDRQIEATLKEAFPDVTRIVDPRAQMAQRLEALRRGGSGQNTFLALLGVVASAVPGDGEATVEEITFRDNALLVTCRTPDFQALDRLQRRFGEDQRVVAELVSSGSRDNSVSGRFQLNLRGA